MKKWTSRGFWLFVAIISFSLLSIVFAQEEELKEVFTYNDHGRRDPFWPLVNSSGVVTNYEKDFLFVDLILEGVIAGDDGNNLAVINGQVLRQGDVLGDFRIVQITEDKVILYTEEKMFELKLKMEE